MLYRIVDNEYYNSLTRTKQIVKLEHEIDILATYSSDAVVFVRDIEGTVDCVYFRYLEEFPIINKGASSDGSI